MEVLENLKRNFREYIEKLCCGVNDQELGERKKCMNWKDVIRGLKFTSWGFAENLFMLRTLSGHPNWYFAEILLFYQRPQNSVGW